MSDDATPSAAAHSDVHGASIPGVLELICGCMFAGKTTELLAQLADTPAERTLVIRHGKDNRYETSAISTHDGNVRSAHTVHHTQDILASVPDGVEVVAIDEGHFYDDTLPAACRQLADRGLRVIVTALDRDMWGLPFPVIEQLRASADIVRVKYARCGVCSAPADRTQRKTPIVGKRLVGGAADFEPRCAGCWSPPPEAHIDSAEMA